MLRMGVPPLRLKVLKSIAGVNFGRVALKPPME